MAKRQIVLIVSAFLLGSSLVLIQPNANSQQKGPEHPPAAPRVDFEETFHGVRLNDRYHWLENFDDPAAAAWIDAQDRYARAYLASRPGQERLRQRYGELSLFSGRDR